jgi:hypothetical protein
MVTTFRALKHQSRRRNSAEAKEIKDNLLLKLEDSFSLARLDLLV